MDLVTGLKITVVVLIVILLVLSVVYARAMAISEQEYEDTKSILGAKEFELVELRVRY